MAAEHATLNYLDFLLKRCILIWALVCLVRGTCPNHPSCQCTANYINCTCHSTDDTPLYITQSPDVFSGKEFVVSQCGKVEVQKLSMNGLDLNLLKFMELGQLNIQSYSLSESNITKILMHNISGLDLESYSLSDIKNCTNLEIINATIENFLPAAVGSIQVKSIDIKDCHIGTVHSRAFSLSKIEKFTMENNYINSFDITSIVIRKATEFNFVRNAVTSTSFGTISVAEIGKVEIEHCSFRQLHGSVIITKEVQSFSFHHCYVETCESRAFWSVEARENLAFFSNEIANAEEDSLIPNHGPAIPHPQLKIKVKNNLLTCDCRLHWIWMEDTAAFQLLKKSSLCNQPEELKGQRLSDLVLSTDHADNCIGLVEKPPNASENYSTSTSVMARKPTKKPKTSNTEIPRPPFSTENSITEVKTTEEAPFIKEASAEKHEYANGGLSLPFHPMPIILTLFLMVHTCAT